MLENGVRWALNHIALEKRILISLDEIEINFCNFQLEGLFFGIANWICKYYQIEMPKHYVEFNKSLNKYIFNFEADSDYWKNLLDNKEE